MTKKLYYEDGYRTEFTGIVLSCEKTKKGYEIVLDQTAFYPEGGGQPADIGKLDDINVTYVYSKEGVIYHVAEASLEVGSQVKGNIDFNRRFDLMQQHSGEHIVSGLVNAKYGYNNVGFHLSNDYTTCDFDGELTKEQMQEIENKANEAVYQNLPISAVIYQDTQIKDWTYRSKLDLKGEIRLVTVPNYDICACCGVHVKATGEIGIIKITNVERHRGGTRVTMLCGSRALRDFQQKQEVTSKACQMLSAKPEVVITNLEKLQEELGEYKQKAALLTSQLFEYKSEEYLRSQEPALFIYEEELSGDSLRRLCLFLIEKTDKNVLVVTGKSEALKYALGAQSNDIRELNKLLTANFGGKGGGKSGLCQGNLCGSIEEIKSFYLLHQGR